MSLVVTLHQTLEALFDFLSGRPIYGLHLQYAVTFCSLPEVASDVVSDTVSKDAGLDVHVKFGNMQLYSLT